MNQSHSLIPDPAILVNAISPDRGVRYSPNLYQWLRKALKRPIPLPGVYRSHDGTLFIGWKDEEFLIGSRLMGVLCNGASEASMAYPGRFSPVENFWPEYALIGRCAIDAEHEISFLGGERWATSGSSRACLWCGNFNQTLQRWTDSVEREEWRPSGRPGASQ